MAMVEVTQADREANAAQWEAAGFTERAKQTREGKWDDDDEVQLLARHRTEALAAAQAEIAELRAALGVAVRHIEHQAKWIGAKNGGYSFEALGEDMPAIRQALGAKP